ncbi:MAG: hypothetical protein ACI9MR_003759 [Myxococcota bacterium]
MGRTGGDNAIVGRHRRALQQQPTLRSAPKFVAGSIGARFEQGLNPSADPRQNACDVFVPWWPNTKEAKALSTTVVEDAIGRQQMSVGPAHRSAGTLAS